MTTVFSKLLKVAVHLAVSINIAGLLTAMTHYPQFQTPLWIAVINLVQVLVLEGIIAYQARTGDMVIDSLPDHNPYIPPDESH